MRKEVRRKLEKENSLYKKKYKYEGYSWKPEKIKKRKKNLKEAGFSVRTIKVPKSKGQKNRITYIYSKKKK